MSKLRMRDIILFAVLLGAPGLVRADDATAFYAPIARAASVANPDWNAVLKQLQQVRVQWIDYRFFYHRARAFYALGQTVAGDSDMAICRLWDKGLSTDEQNKIDHDLDAARSYSMTHVAIGHVRPGIDISGLHANHVDHDK